jgi:hypothetical protein
MSSTLAVAEVSGLSDKFEPANKGSAYVETAIIFRALITARTFAQYRLAINSTAKKRIF